jgi:hypothetical protein
MYPLLQVSVDGRIKEKINKNMLHIDIHVFDEAQAQIYKLMQRDSYPRFIGSKMYRNAVTTYGNEIQDL